MEKSAGKVNLPHMLDKLTDYRLFTFCLLIKFFDGHHGMSRRLHQRDQLRNETICISFFLNIGHFLDHLFVLIFATAVIKRAVEWDLA